MRSDRRQGAGVHISKQLKKLLLRVGSHTGYGRNRQPSVKMSSLKSKVDTHDPLNEADYKYCYC